MFILKRGFILILIFGFYFPIQASTIYVKDFVKIRDSITDQSLALQKAIDIAVKLNADSLIFPASTITINTVHPAPGIVYFAPSKCTLKKIASATKWSRMFETQSGLYVYDNVADSKPMAFINLQFDGNITNQGPYKNYELQQQHLLMLSARSNNGGRLKVRIENCSFSNAVADGISIYCNTDVQIKNCKSANVFRGGIVVTGGNSSIAIDGYKSFGTSNKAGIHVEVDGSGYNHNQSIVMTMKNILLQSSKLNLTFSAGTITIDKLQLLISDFHINTKGLGTVYFQNSQITNQESLIEIYYPKQITFKSCNFFFKPSPQKDLLFNIVWNTNGTKHTNQLLLFEKCTFNSTKIAKEFAGICFTSQYDSEDFNNKLEINACKFYNFNIGLQLKQGGNIKILNSYLDCSFPIMANAVPKNTHNFKYEEQKCIFSKNVKTKHTFTNSEKSSIQIK